MRDRLGARPHDIEFYVGFKRGETSLGDTTTKKMADNVNPQPAGSQQQQSLAQQATQNGHQQNGSTGAASQAQAVSQPSFQHQFQALQHQQILAQQYALHQQGLLTQQQNQLPNNQYITAAIQAQLQQGLVAPGQQQIQVVQQIPQSFVAGNSLPTPAQQQRVPATQQPAQRRPEESQKDVATVAASNKVSCKHVPDAEAVTVSEQKPEVGPEETATTGTPAAAAAAAPAQHHPPVASSFTSGISSTAASLIHGALRDSSPDEGNGPSKGSQSNDDQHVAADRSTDTTTVEERRDRNRNNAKATRVRKKAYVNKLKELLDGLHAERNEDARIRRVAVRRLAEIQDLRRRVVRTFLRNHAVYGCSDRTGWATILEENFSMKQPVTPYRSFRRSEIQKVRFSCQLTEKLELFLPRSSGQFSGLTKVSWEPISSWRYTGRTH